MGLTAGAGIEGWRGLEVSGSGGGVSPKVGYYRRGHNGEMKKKLLGGKQCWAPWKFHAHKGGVKGLLEENNCRDLKGFGL